MHFHILISNIPVYKTKVNIVKMTMETELTQMAKPNRKRDLVFSCLSIWANILANFLIGYEPIRLLYTGYGVCMRQHKDGILEYPK